MHYKKKVIPFGMIKEILEKEEKEKSSRKVLLVDDEIKFCDLL